MKKTVDIFLMRIFPWSWYKVPRLSYSLQPENIGRSLQGQNLPKRLTQTHFAILSYLRLQKDEKILQSELYKRLGWSSLTLKKFSRKTVELKKLGLLTETKDESDRRQNSLSITERGLDILKKAEIKRKNFLLNIFRRTDIYELQKLLATLERLTNI